MEILNTASKIMMFVFLFASMLGIGLHLDLKDIPEVFKAKWLLIRSLGANFIVIPAIGILIAKMIPMPPEVALAFIVLALAPGGLSSIQFISKIKDESAYAGCIVFLLSVLSVFISPLLISFFLPKDMELTIPYWHILWILLIALFLPLLLGVLLHHKHKLIATKLVKPVALLGTLAFFCVVLLTLGLKRLAMSAHTIEIIGVMLLFVILSMLVGWLMGGPRRGARQVLAIVSSMRNVALCLVMAIETVPNAKVITPLVALGALMILPNMLFTLFTMIRRRNLTK